MASMGICSGKAVRPFDTLHQVVSVHTALYLHQSYGLTPLPVVLQNSNGFDTDSSCILCDTLLTNKIIAYTPLILVLSHP